MFAPKSGSGRERPLILCVNFAHKGSHYRPPADNNVCEDSTKESSWNHTKVKPQQFINELLSKHGGFDGWRNANKIFIVSCFHLSINTRMFYLSFLVFGKTKSDS